MKRHTTVKPHPCTVKNWIHKCGDPLKKQKLPLLIGGKSRTPPLDSWQQANIRTQNYKLPNKPKGAMQRSGRGAQALSRGATSHMRGQDIRQTSVISMTLLVARMCDEIAFEIFRKILKKYYNL